MVTPFKVLRQLAHRRIRRFWSRLAAQATVAPVEALREQRQQARQLRRTLDNFLQVAEDRLAPPVIGSDATHRQPGTDWIWRPDPWRYRTTIMGQASVATQAEVGPGVQLFHDCRISELTLRQVRNTRPTDLAPFGMRLDVFRFDGSYLSLVTDLPDTVCTDLRKRHVIRVDCSFDMEKPIEVYARLNLRQGPNVEQVVRSIPKPAAAVVNHECFVEFDLAYAKLDDRRIERLWLDLILEGPEMNQIVLRDITFGRRLRAGL